MRLMRHSLVLPVLLVLPGSLLPAQQKAPSPNAKPAKHSALLAPSDGLAVITAALDAHTRHSKTDCSHLVHEIYERAGFEYEYASSSDLYAGTSEFRPVKHPQPGDLVVWPGHVGIVVNPAQRSFYSALSSGLGVDAYDSDYWKERGKPRFFRYVKPPLTAEHAGK